MILVKNIFELRANTLCRALHLRSSFVYYVTKTTLISANAVFPRDIPACVERCSKSKLVLSITRHSFKTIVSDPDSVLHSLTRRWRSSGFVWSQREIGEGGVWSKFGLERRSEEQGVVWVAKSEREEFGGTGCRAEQSSGSVCVESEEEGSSEQRRRLERYRERAVRARALE
ncbi:hypothetical protein MA16_Dca008027 [Dendrobium catenatum]|uniref:Uncharacterized protein n=1 Tax=Dendrobium catenatum TaxID=906689 RepID=A0A2I0VL44_9ASPA|nr:hypothetical protein MA16_Dca008027 [Dendrobium catenatum]